jgi:hypothetical protein
VLASVGLPAMKAETWVAGSSLERKAPAYSPLGISAPLGITYKHLGDVPSSSDSFSRSQYHCDGHELPLPMLDIYDSCDAAATVYASAAFCVLLSTFKGLIPGQLGEPTIFLSRYVVARQHLCLPALTVSPFLHAYSLCSLLCSFPLQLFYLIVGRFVPHGVTKVRIEALSTSAIGNETECTERCTICLGDWEVTEEVTSLKCTHAFHSECVDPRLLVEISPRFAKPTSANVTLSPAITLFGGTAPGVDLCFKFYSHN